MGHVAYVPVSNQSPSMPTNQTKIEIIFLTMHDEPDILHRDGAWKGYILKECALSEVVNGVRSVAGGRPFVSASLAGTLFQRKSKAQEFEKNVPGLGMPLPLRSGFSK